MTFNVVTLGRAVAFIKCLPNVVSLIHLPKTLNLQKIFPIFLFLSDLTLLIENTSGAYN